MYFVESWVIDHLSNFQVYSTTLHDPRHATRSDQIPFRREDILELPGSDDVLAKERDRLWLLYGSLDRLWY